MKRLILCVTVLVLAASSLPAEVRTWRSANGKFSVKAELVEVLDGKARLRKEDGRVITVPIANASFKAADIEIKPKKQNNNIVIEVKGKQQNMVEMILIDKNGKRIKTMTSTFSMGGGPTTHSFMPQGGSLPTDVGLRVTDVVGSKSVEVPFAVSGLKIEQPNTANHTMPIPFFGK